MDNTELHLARGDAARALLKAEAFMAASNEVVNAYMGQIVSSKPEDTEARERAYMGVKAVQDIVGVLNQWQSVAAQIRMAANDAAENDE